MLGSASDDFQVILWDPFMQKIKTTIKTLHRGNIFTVKVNIIDNIKILIYLEQVYLDIV